MNNTEYFFLFQIQRTLIGGPLNEDQFALLQFHFHWGKDKSEGSEHTLDGEKFSGELHLVHTNLKYSTLEDILGNGDGLAVVGIFIEESKKSPKEIKKFLKAAAKVRRQSCSALAC